MYSAMNAETPGPIGDGEIAGLLANAGITGDDLACLTDGIDGGKLVVGVFSGVAAYDVDPAVHGLSVGGTIDRTCNGARVQALDPTATLNEQLTVKGICWDNGTATFSVSTDGGPPPPAPMIVHGEGEPGGDPFTAPCSGYIDPRRESTNGAAVNLGMTSIRILFNTSVFGDASGGAVTAGNFSVATTGGTPQTVSGVTMLGPDYVEVSLDGFPPLQEWTTIVADVYNSAGVQIDHSGGNMGSSDEPDRVDFAYLPGNIDQNNSVQPLDLLRMRQRLLDSCPATCPDCGGQDDFYFDIDRNGIIQALDLLRWRQLWFGTSPSTQVWQSESLNNPRP
jgi:hypothetical protein